MLMHPAGSRGGQQACRVDCGLCHQLTLQALPADISGCRQEPVRPAGGTLAGGLAAGRGEAAVDIAAAAKCVTQLLGTPTCLLLVMAEAQHVQRHQAYHQMQWLMRTACQYLLVPVVDGGAVQVCEPRVLFGMRSDARELATDSDPAAWMWGGKHTEAALEKFAREGEWQQGSARVCGQ